MIKAWRETVTIPTYEVGKAEKNPIFLEKRVYQGSSGVVYPYPVIESIADKPTPKEWHVVFLENEYIKVMVMPELGGRIQMAYDKIKQRHFVYYNHVIKPALVGLCGPWISGGIEFNWPQHHRPSTYMPVDCDIVENEDGSVTVWVNEMERMFHQKGAAGFTLRPGCAYLEIQGRVSNRTPLPQTFLWWANPAVEVNDAYQSVFPPDVNAVFDHGKRAVSSFPIATGTYYKMDYSAGVDISNYKNIKVPTSYMAVNSKYDFEGGYENDTQGGMLHVASHHVSPGKKQWTWGNGDFGRAWDRNLTDEASASDGFPAGSIRTGFRPYIELMAGVYTENQPDFTWLMPYEEKQFTQYFMPYRELGVVKQASKDFIFNVEKEGDRFHLMVLATSKQTVDIVFDARGGDIHLTDRRVTLSPEEVFHEWVDADGLEVGDTGFRIMPVGRNHWEPVLKWFAEEDKIRPIPDAAEAALSPVDTKTNDQLYLTGLHLEQYRHATWSALDYYEEALRRDPNDVRCLNQTGLWYLRRGRFDKAKAYLERAVRIWQKRNPNPYDGEPMYNLGVAEKYQHFPPCGSESIRALFLKAAWNKSCADAAYYHAACYSVSQGHYETALDEVNRSLLLNSCHHKARAMKAAILRLIQTDTQKGDMQMGSAKQLNERVAFIKESLQLDHFNYGILYEDYLLTKDEEVLKHMVELMHGSANNYHELALDYMEMGMRNEALAILELALKPGVEPSPMTYYYMGCASGGSICKDYYRQAEEADPSYCFPNRLEDVSILEDAKHWVPDGGHTPYYLGCLYYDKRQYDLAVENWELSAKNDPSFPTVWRNLALARFNKSLPPTPSKERGSEAVEYMERAFHLDETDARMLMELDQLYKRLHRPHQERLDFLQHYPLLISQRDDLSLEEITLLNQLGRFEEAKEKLDAHKFHPWEGGEGKVPAQYQICRVELAKKSLTPNPGLTPAPSPKGEGSLKGEGSDYSQAIKLLQDCLEYPHHLGEGKLYGAQENDFYYLLGLAYDMQAEENSSFFSHHSSFKEKARECYEKGTAGPTEPAAAMYYNDAKPDKIFYAGLCYRALGQEDKARGLFNKLISYGKQHLFDHVTMDYFAVSLPDLLIWDDSLDERNRIHCHYMLALGYYGMGDTKRAEDHLARVRHLDNNHQGVQQLQSFMTVHH